MSDYDYTSPHDCWRCDSDYPLGGPLRDTQAAQPDINGVQHALAAARRHDYFFFFQAEDGIRDLTVTGVQTCALPISFLTNRPTTSSIASFATCSTFASSIEPRAKA